MFRRIQQLRISLAAKCQLLFGAAVLLIIAAALFVPWQRIEQLTEQLNERTAAALAENALADHVAGRGSWPLTQASGLPRGGPATLPLGRASTRPAVGQTQPAGDIATPPRLTGLGRRRDGSDLARFEGRAAAHFLRQRDTVFFSAYYDRKDGGVGYRYAQPVLWGRSCAACHAPVAAPAPGATRPSTDPSSTNPSSTNPSPADVAALTSLVTDPLPDPADAAADDDRRGGDPDKPRPLAGVVVVDFSSRIDANQLLLNRVFILTAGTVAGVLAIVTFYFITTRLILQPVRVLQETAEKVAKGDLNIRSDIFTGDEFQQLSETFNVMLTNLKGSADQLRAMNKSLDLKLGQLAESNVALYESNRLKSEFLANVSHELRTPLNSILGFADLLKDAPATGADAKTARYVNNILTSGRNLLELINDLLDLAKIEAGKMEVRSEPLSVSDMFEGLANLLKPLVEQKRLTLTMTVGADVPLLQTDPGKLQQVLYNFLSNAIKFSPAGQAVELRAVLEPAEAANTPAGGSGGGDGIDLPPATPRLPRPERAAAPSPADAEPHVRISVSDHGQGIAPEQQHVIFEKFRQVEGGHTRTHSGTGLGLAISKELTLLMGGTIGLKSKAGEGASFWVRLPLKIAAGPRDVRSRMVMS